MTAATYGELLNEALLEIAAAWQEPPRFAAGAEAVAAAQARTRLNRGAARALRRYTTEPWFATPARDPVRGRGESHQPHLQGLAAELATSAGATAGVLDLPAGPVRTTARPGSLAGRLTRAAEAADGAWDLLASHLTGDGQPRTPAGETVRGRLARALATDALLLARGVAGLDTRLGSALCRTALDPATGALTRPALLHVAEDCLRHQRQTPARHRPAVRRRGRRRPARRRLDLDRQHRPGPAATAGPAGQPRAGRRRGRQVPHVAGRPRRRTDHRRPGHPRRHRVPAHQHHRPTRRPHSLAPLPPQPAPTAHRPPRTRRLHPRGPAGWLDRPAAPRRRPHQASPPRLDDMDRRRRGDRRPATRPRQRRRHQPRPARLTPTTPYIRPQEGPVPVAGAPHRPTGSAPPTTVHSGTTPARAHPLTAARPTPGTAG